MKTNDISAVIAIGGKGTRLKSITGSIPKPLFPINKTSPLHRICLQLKEYNISEVHLTLGYCSEMFDKEIKNINSKLGLKINTFKEKTPLGECGALWEIKNLLKKDILFINGDLIFSIDLKRFIKFHKRLDSRLTLLTHTSTHPEDSDLISAPNGTLIEKLFLKSIRNNEDSDAYLGNAGMALFNSDLLNLVKCPEPNDNASLLNYLAYKAYLENISIYSYNTSEYIKDMGTEKRFRQVEKDLNAGVVDKHSYKNTQKALFLDRDNTLIKCKPNEYIVDKNNLEFLNEEIKKISNIARNYDLVCMVTNQPQIARGILTIEQLDQINSLIIKYCLTCNLKIDIVSFCPHHPHSGFNNEIKILKTDCFCRKPNPGLLFELAFARNIDLSNSLLIGDSINDEQAAKNAGCNFLNVNKL